MRRHFPLVFLEPAIAASSRAADMRLREWTVQVDASRDDTVSAAVDGANRVLGLMAVAALASAIALLQTVRAVRANAKLASMKSEFVSAVTHELKTPLALIRLVADTLARGRYSSPEIVSDYAGLLSRETARLSQSIDNLLTYARYTDGSAGQSLDVAPHDVADLVEDALERFQPTLAELEFQVTIDVPRELPRVAVDGRAIVQAIEIVIDNAIKYSGRNGTLHMAARVAGKQVRLTIVDRGVGVPEDDLAHVFDRFYRGRNAEGSGSGLGLAIARRILRHHGGEISMRSAVGAGTEVEVVFPTAGAA
jgi:signal transduction histidine kinase